jgi:hypothetical protein
MVDPYTYNQQKGAAHAVPFFFAFCSKNGVYFLKKKVKLIKSDR